MAAIHDLSATEMSAAYARGELSPVEVTLAALARIDAWEPAINAMYLVHADRAIDAAHGSETRWRSGAPLSPLDGVPITIKENITTAGDPAPIGTRANANLVAATADAPPAARVRAAGCILLGKTTMPDYGMLSSGLSSLHGITRNPWRLDRNPSGSSSGAAAAAVAGYGPLHLGTDIGGSVRLPATHCGLFSLKPTLGRVPIYPPYIGRAVGPITRTVADSAAVMNVLIGPDARDYMSIAAQTTDYLDAVTGDHSPWLKGLRIGYLADAKLGTPLQSDVHAAAAAAARALEQAGATVEEIPPFMTAAMLDGVCRFFEARSFNDVMALSEERQQAILPFILEWCTHRAQHFSGRDVMGALNELFALREATVRATTAYDFVLSPTSPITAFEASFAAPGNDPHDALPHIAYTLPYNMSEQPAASVPWTTSADQLPIGIQIAGRRFDDLGVMRLAQVLEQLRPPLPGWPELQT